MKHDNLYLANFDYHQLDIEYYNFITFSQMFSHEIFTGMMVSRRGSYFPQIGLVEYSVLFYWPG